MALQVRLRHALGERVLDLRERGVAEPLVIGRATDADVQVPSVSVSPHHCALFVHEGQWVVQGTAGVTKLNGIPVSGPAALSIGDRIAIGNDPSPPTLEIDPLGAAEGASGPARASLPAPAATAPTPLMNWQTPPPAPVARPMGPPQPLYAAAAPPQVQGFETAEGQEEAASDQVDWTPAAPTLHSGRYYIPRRRTSSGVGRAFAIVLGLAVLGGAGFYVYRRTRQPPPPPPPPVAQTRPAVEEDDTPTFHSKLFDTGGARPQAPANASPAPLAAASTPLTQATGSASDGKPAPPAEESADAPEPRRPANADATWEDVQARHYEVERQGPAIIAFDEYRRLHPGQFDKELDRYTDDAVNWIWWLRVNQLWGQRDRLAEAIRKKKQDVRAQPEGSFHDRLVAEQRELEAQYAKVQQTLTVEMGYNNDKPPDVKNPAALKELSKTRDPGKYAAFKKRILNYVRIHHGDLPWSGSG